MVWMSEGNGVPIRELLVVHDKDGDHYEFTDRWSPEERMQQNDHEFHIEHCKRLSGERVWE